VSAPALRIEVIYAGPAGVIRRELRLNPGCTAGDALRASGVLESCPEIDLARNRVGIFGRLATPDAPLRDGDRVEIYRPLIADPKDARRSRAKRAKRA